MGHKFGTNFFDIEEIQFVFTKNNQENDDIETLKIKNQKLMQENEKLLKKNKELMERIGILEAEKQKKRKAADEQDQAPKKKRKTE